MLDFGTQGRGEKKMTPVQHEMQQNNKNICNNFIQPLLALQMKVTKSLCSGIPNKKGSKHSKGRARTRA